MQKLVYTITAVLVNPPPKKNPKQKTIYKWSPTLFFCYFQNRVFTRFRQAVIAISNVKGESLNDYFCYV